MKNLKTASQKRYNRLRLLIEACAEKFSEEEMLSAFSDYTGKDYAEDKSQDEIISDLTIEGYCIFKPDSGQKANQLKEYAETVIFPYYNEQQASILY